MNSKSSLFFFVFTIFCALLPSFTVAFLSSPLTVSKTNVEPLTRSFLFGGGKKKEDEGGKAGGGNPFSLDNLKKMNEITQKTNTIQKELAGLQITGSALDGGVKVVFTGTQIPLDVVISEEAMGQSPEKLSEALTEAMKDAHTKSTETMQQKLTDFYSELGLPNMFGKGGPGM